MNYMNESLHRAPINSSRRQYKDPDRECVSRPPMAENEAYRVLDLFPPLSSNWVIYASVDLEGSAKIVINPDTRRRLDAARALLMLGIAVTAVQRNQANCRLHYLIRARRGHG